MKPPEPLSPEQQAVVEYVESDLFVSACPGAGKTHAVIERFISRCQPLPRNRGVAIVSFSRVAAIEAQKRCHERSLSHLLNFPHFVGTLDSFFIRYLYLPLAQARLRRRVRVLDSWEAIGACVQLRGAKAVKGKGVPLDAFPYDGVRVQLDQSRLRSDDKVWRQKLQQNLADWEKAATARRKGLHDSGLRTCDDMRVAVAQTFSGSRWHFILRALAARFCEVIVDEAQDCDELQVSVLEHLRSAGIRLVVVADVDQAIYEFRKASPATLLKLAGTMHSLPIRGNRRSAPAICAVANSLVSAERANIKSVGETKNCLWPVRVIPYETGAEREAGIDFCKHADERGCHDKLVVAHSRALALKAAGMEVLTDSPGGSSAALLQAALRLAHGVLNAKARVAAFSEIERIILRRLGAKQDDQTIGDICLCEKIERRWLQASGVALLRTLTKLLANRTTITLGDAVAVARDAAESLSPPPGRVWSRSASSIFKIAGKRMTDAVKLPRRSTTPLDVIVSTVHGVKGGAADAVLFVISRNVEVARSLLSAWRSRTAEDEAKRVAYVGITRARRLLGLAVPAALSGELVCILREREVDLEEAPVCQRSREQRAAQEPRRVQRPTNLDPEGAQAK